MLIGEILAKLGRGEKLSPEELGSLSREGNRLQSFQNKRTYWPFFVPNARLTLTSATFVTTADVTGAGTIYYYGGAGKWMAPLPYGDEWEPIKMTAELSLAVTLTSGKNYDVFLWNDGGPKLALSAAWTNDTTPANAPTWNNGAYVNSAAIGSLSIGAGLWIGSLRASGTNTTQDAAASRWLWNMYNRRPRPLLARDTANTWLWSTASFQAADANTTDGVGRTSIVLGLSEDLVFANYTSRVSNDTATARGTTVGIGIDSTSVSSAFRYIRQACTSTTVAFPSADYSGFPGIGYHYIQSLELGAGTDNQTWVGDSGITTLQTGQVGMVMG